MSKRPIFASAEEPIPYGALVLVRGGRASRADAALANAVVREPPYPRAHGHYEVGDHLSAEPFEELGERDLHAIANGPIMEPSRVYLPAGKLSEAEYQERLALDFKRAGIEPT